MRAEQFRYLAVQDWKLEGLRQEDCVPRALCYPKPLSSNPPPITQESGKHLLWECPGSMNSKTKAQTNKQETWTQETGATSQESWVLKKEGQKHNQATAAPVWVVSSTRGARGERGHRHTKQRQSLTPGRAKSKS